jgi:GntR family transcriptional repressor for pyruvate dehydrogenase complex
MSYNPTMPYRPAPIRRESVTAKAAEEICRYIQAERLAPGRRLPGELQLASMLGISRTSLREALRILDGLGFVEKRPDKGIVVKGVGLPAGERGPGRQAIVDAVSVALQVRTLVEARCAELAAAAAPEEPLVEMESHLSRFDEALKRGDLVAATQAHVAFHETLIAAAGNPFLTSIFQALRFAVTEIGPLALKKSGSRRTEVDAHRQIYDAVCRRDARRAAAAVKRHFRDIGGVVEFHLRNRRGVADNGKPSGAGKA